MKGINRRRFLQLACAGSLVAATAGTTVGVTGLATASRLSATSKQGRFTFRAVTGLPSKPLPSYASYVLEGHLNLTTRSRAMPRTVVALRGAPTPHVGRTPHPYCMVTSLALR